MQQQMHHLSTRKDLCRGDMRKVKMNDLPPWITCRLSYTFPFELQTFMRATLPISSMAVFVKASSGFPIIIENMLNWPAAIHKSCLLLQYFVIFTKAARERDAKRGGEWIKYNLSIQKVSKNHFRSEFGVRRGSGRRWRAGNIKIMAKRLKYKKEKCDLVSRKKKKKNEVSFLVQRCSTSSSSSSSVHNRTKASAMDSQPCPFCAVEPYRLPQNDFFFKFSLCNFFREVCRSALITGSAFHCKALRFLWSGNRFGMYFCPFYIPHCQRRSKPSVRDRRYASTYTNIPRC